MAPPGHGPRRGARAGLRCSRDLRAPRPSAPALTSAPASQLVPSPDPAPGVPRPRARPRPPHAGPGAHPTPVRSRGRAEGDTTGHIPFSPALPSFTPAPATCTVPVLVPALGSRTPASEGAGAVTGLRAELQLPARTAPPGGRGDPRCPAPPVPAGRQSSGSRSPTNPDAHRAARGLTGPRPRPLKGAASPSRSGRRRQPFLRGRGVAPALPVRDPAPGVALPPAKGCGEAADRRGCRAGTCR